MPINYDDNRDRIIYTWSTPPGTPQTEWQWEQIRERASDGALYLLGCGGPASDFGGRKQAYLITIRGVQAWLERHYGYHPDA